MVVNATKISQKMKNKSLLSIEKNKIEYVIITIKNYFLKNNDLESSFDEEYKDVLKSQF